VHVALWLFPLPLSLLEASVWKQAEIPILSQAHAPWHCVTPRRLRAARCSAIGPSFPVLDEGFFRLNACSRIVFREPEHLDYLSDRTD
jgi:hypothetical protein